jgi:chromosome segregation ATPase
MSQKVAESNTAASGGSGANSDMQLILQMLKEGAENRIADKAERDKQFEQMQEKLEKHSREIQEQIKVKVVEINKVREECHKKYEQLEKKFSAEIAAEIRQVRSNISSIEEIREKELIEIKGQMRADNKRQDETSLGIQRQVSENRERIDKSESTIVEVTQELANLNVNVQQVNIRVEKEAEENQRRQRERDATFEQQIKLSQAKVAEELHKIEKEVISLEQDLSTPVVLQGSGTKTLAPQSDKDSSSNKTINLQPEVREELFRKVIQE